MVEPGELEAQEAELVTAASGSCGANVQWAFAGDTLTISGTGPMDDYKWDDDSRKYNMPWRDLSRQVKTIVIQNGVTSIGEEAFDGCANLTQVTIPNSVTSIGDGAFYDCASLRSVTFPAGVTSVGRDTFSGTPWEIAHHYFVIVNGVLFGWHNGDRVEGPRIAIPDGVTRIADYACEGGEYTPVTLAAVTFPDSLVEIGAGAFGMHQMTRVTLPASVAFVGDKAFAVNNLTSVTILNPNCKIVETSEPYYDFPYADTFSGAAIRGYDGSTAEAFAREHGYKFVSLGKAPGSPRYMVYYKQGGGQKKLGTITSAAYTHAAPTVKISKVAGGIKVTWNKITGSPRYMVYYKENGGGWVKIGTTTATTYTRKAAQLKNGVTYQFAVRCCENDKKTLLGPYKASNSLKYTK